MNVIFSTYFVMKQISQCCTEQQPAFVVVIIWHPLKLCGRNEIFYALSQDCEQRLLPSSCPSVRPPAWEKSAPTGRIFTTFDV